MTFVQSVAVFKWNSHFWETPGIWPVLPRHVLSYAMAGLTPIQ